jgi:ABC-type transporter Mla subunit MlaD
MNERTINDLDADDAELMASVLEEMINGRTNEARQILDELEATLATLAKLVRDIEPSYCTDTDLASLYIATDDLALVEGRLADLCAKTNEIAEVAL